MSSTVILFGAVLVSAIFALASMGIFYVIRRRRLARRANRHESSRAKCKYMIEEDISNGRELNKVPAFSHTQGDSTPLDFHYVNEHVCVDPVQVDTSLGRMSCCQCLGDCAGNECECIRLNSSGPHYDQEGRLTMSYMNESVGAIRECNVGCKCNRKLCKNMVVQSGSKLQVALFKTKSRGWGVRALEPIANGTFIGNYSGELISADSSTKRLDDTYLFNLSNSIILRSVPAQSSDTTGDQSTIESSEHVVQSEQVGAILRAHQSEIEGREGEEYSPQPLGVDEPDQGEQVEGLQSEIDHKPSVQEPASKEQYFICDAKFYGNFTRFINHSCEPNLIGIRTFTSHQDERFPYISFFANRNIGASEELTLNYGDNYWLVKCRRDNVYCLCNTPACKFTKKNFKQTLKRHNQQVAQAHAGN